MKPKSPPLDSLQQIPSRDTRNINRLPFVYLRNLGAHCEGLELISRIAVQQLNQFGIGERSLFLQSMFRHEGFLAKRGGLFRCPVEQSRMTCLHDLLNG